jgi:transcriptional regulator with XRE-family HTH domain
MGRGEMNMSHDARALGHRIWLVRKSLRVTNATVAAKTGLSRGHLWKIEQGLTPVKSGTLLAIANALDVNVLRFFEPNPLEQVR